MEPSRRTAGSLWTMRSCWPIDIVVSFLFIVKPLLGVNKSWLHCYMSSPLSSCNHIILQAASSPCIICDSSGDLGFVSSSVLSRERSSSRRVSPREEFSVRARVYFTGIETTRSLLASWCFFSTVKWYVNSN